MPLCADQHTQLLIGLLALGGGYFCRGTRCQMCYCSCMGRPWFLLQEEFEDNKRVTRIRISKKNIQHSGQKKKYKRSNRDRQNMHIKQGSSKGPGCSYDTCIISVAICDTEISQRSTKSWWGPKNFRRDDFNLTKSNPPSRKF